MAAIRPVLFRAFSGALAASALAAPAAAGVFASPGRLGSAYSPRPTGGEATPNLYGVGANLDAGYSFGQVVDLGIFGRYLPGTAGHTEIGKGDGSLVSYGGELAGRFGESVYVGLRYGASVYQLAHMSDPGELAGTWSGAAAGFSIGAVAKLSKTGFVQTTFDYMQYELADRADASAKRTFDGFGIGIAYVYNSVGGGSAASNTIFKNFLDSITFF